ncbi:hypothetical protein Dimus_026118 [Dionaea muscipula]
MTETWTPTTRIGKYHGSVTTGQRCGTLQMVKKIETCSSHDRVRSNQVGNMIESCLTSNGDMFESTAKGRIFDYRARHAP